MKSLVATSLAHFVNDGNIYVFITLYPRLFPLSSELFLIGVLASLQNLFSVLTSPFVGRFADARRNYGALLSMGLILLGISIGGYSLSVLFFSGFSLFLFLIPFSIIAGIGSSFYHPLGGSVLNQTWESTSLGRVMGLNGSSGSFGRAIYPLVVVSLAAYLSIPSVITLAVLSFAIAFLALGMLRGLSFGSAKPHESQQVRKMAIPVRSIIPLILPLTIVSFLKGIFSFGIVNFIPEYLEQIMGLRYELELGLIFSIILAMAILGQPVFGSFADRFGRRLALAVSIAGSAIAILVVMNVSNLYFQVVSFAVFGFFVFTGFPLLLPLATSAVPKEAATFSNSIVWGVGNTGGGAIGPVLIGLLTRRSLLGSLTGAFYVVTILSLFSLLILPFVPKAQTKKDGAFQNPP